MQDNIRFIKLANVMQICAYILTYILAFNAYDASGVNNIEGSDYQSLTVYVMVMIGLAFTMSMLKYRLIISNVQIASELVFVYDILQLAFMIMAVVKALDMKEVAKFGDDIISLLHSSLALIMSFIVLTIHIISLSIDIGLCIGKNDRSSLIQCEQSVNRSNEKSHLHVPAIIILVGTFIMCSLYSYSIVGLVFFMWFFIIAFPLPMWLFLSSVVREWIEKKKYIWAICAYLIYMYMAYGVLHNLFYETIYGYSVGRSAMKFGFNGFVGWINVFTGGIVVIVLVIKAAKEKRESLNS